MTAKLLPIVPNSARYASRSGRGALAGSVAASCVFQCSGRSPRNLARSDLAARLPRELAIRGAIGGAQSVPTTAVCAACQRGFRGIPQLTKAGVVCSTDGTLQLPAYEFLSDRSGFCTPCLEVTVAGLQSELWKDRATDAPELAIGRLLKDFRRLTPDDVVLGASASVAEEAQVHDLNEKGVTSALSAGAPDAQPCPRMQRHQRERSGCD